MFCTKGILIVGDIFKKLTVIFCSYSFIRTQNYSFASLIFSRVNYVMYLFITGYEPTTMRDKVKDQKIERIIKGQREESLESEDVVWTGGSTL